MDHCQMLIANMMWCFDSFCYIGTATTPCFNKTVIGGNASRFSGVDNSFIIDFSAHSFPNGNHVNISVCLDRSLHFEIPKEYKILSQTYQISASEKLQRPVNFTLKHSAVITTEEEAMSLVILHQNDDEEIKKIYGYTKLNSSFITFQLSEFCGGLLTGPNNITVIYKLSFYQQKPHYDSNPSLKIRALISQSESIHKVSYMQL